MGYDLHITRREEWPESEVDPIPLSEFIAIAEGRAGWAADPVAAPAHQTAPANWRFDNPGNPGASFLAHWAGGQVTVYDPSDEAVTELVAVADESGAMVVGDEPIRYFADGTTKEFD